MGGGTRKGAIALSAMFLGKATSRDLPEVIQLEGVCYGDPWPATAFATLPENPRVFFAVARENHGGPLAGYLVAWYVMDEGELANLAVVPSARRKGIGSSLLDAMFADADARGIRQIYLEVRESNDAARQLYAARGFEAIGRRKGYYRSPEEDALILRCTLK